MPRLYYAVLATLPTEAIAAEYLDWLGAGHIDQVRAGGAESATIVRLDRRADDGLPLGAVRVLTQYLFPSRAAFDRYERGFAPALRAEGRRRFGPERGVEMMRMVGDVLNEPRTE